jgi:hypothetical protein
VLLNVVRYLEEAYAVPEPATAIIRQKIAAMLSNICTFFITLLFCYFA